MRYLI
jgi:hypothetical protein